VQPGPSDAPLTPLPAPEPATAAPEAGPHCPNCSAPAAGRFCASCGQEQRELRIPFRRALAEALDEALSLDSRLARTLPALFLHPGAATRAWREGRRASSTSPTKLYLLASFLFFLALALAGGLPVQIGTGKAAGATGAAANPHPVNAAPGSLAELRASGWIGAAFADHLERLSALPAEEASRRIGDALSGHAAQAMFVLVPLMALVLKLLHARRGVYYTEHLTLAVHAQTVTFAFLLPGVIAGSPGAALAGLAASGLHLLLAMRRVYGTGWVGTLARWLALSFAWVVALSLAVLAATAAAVLTA